MFAYRPQGSTNRGNPTAVGGGGRAREAHRQLASAEPKDVEGGIQQVGGSIRGVRWRSGDKRVDGMHEEGENNERSSGSPSPTHGRHGQLEVWLLYKRPGVSLWLPTAPTIYFSHTSPSARLYCLGRIVFCAVIYCSGVSTLWPRRCFVSASFGLISALHASRLKYEFAGANG